MFAYPDINTRGVERIRDCYANPRRTPLAFISSYANTESVFYCLNIYYSGRGSEIHYACVLSALMRDALFLIYYYFVLLEKSKADFTVENILSLNQYFGLPRRPRGSQSGRYNVRTAFRNICSKIIYSRL